MVLELQQSQFRMKKRDHDYGMYLVNSKYVPAPVCACDTTSTVRRPCSFAVCGDIDIIVKKYR